LCVGQINLGVGLGGKMQRVMRGTLVAGLAIVFAWTSTAFANSCSNLTVLGTCDESGLREGNLGIYAVGTFRIEDESDESKQPMFNLSTVNCEKKVDDAGKAALATPGKGEGSNETAELWLFIK
jgi:hypothetical protein